MKKFFSMVLLMACSIALVAQSNNNQDEVVKIDRWNQQAYREGEVIVKFKADGAVQMRKNVQGKFQTASISQVDALFAELGVEEVEALMPNVGARKAPRRMRAYNGTEVQDHDLSKLYLIRFSEQVAAPMSNAGEMRSVHQVIEQLQALEEVEFAEPNYMVYTLATNNVDINADKYDKEPLYTQQWGPAAIGLPSLWSKPLISTKRPVIAIIDTGVDCEHPDLKDNLWVNEKEKNGVAGKDDDGNGIVDDIHGYDFVNQTGGMADFNGHGTHCAGIAAAVGHNGIGITGANPDALIMPITVMQSDGTGDVATIIKGIDYAAANGADVISMSLGGYSHSIAEEQALGKAYATAVIVAAAGNDFKCINQHMCPINKHNMNAPMFPAAFQFVLGVEAAADKQGNLASFSNFDDDGPTYSEYSSETQLYNYELRAPGQSVVSTFPKGQYRAMNGTSMACPLAAGAISRLLMHKEYDSWEILFGDLIHTRTNGTGNIDMKAAYDITDADRKPTLSLVTYYLTDSLGDNDGRADAGETIAIYPVLRNEWGQAENIKVWMELAETENDTIVKFLEQKVDFGMPLSSYAKNKSANPIRFVIDKNVVDGRRICMVLKATCDNMESTLEQEVILTAENGVEIGGMITEDLTLYPGVHYIVTKPIAVPEGVTLTLKPGTVLKFKDDTGLSTAEGAHLIAQGTPDSMIVFTMADLALGSMNGFGFFTKDTLQYCIFEYLEADMPSLHPVIETTSSIINCIIRYNMVNTFVLSSGSHESTRFADNISRNNIYGNNLFYATFSHYGVKCLISDNNVIENYNRRDGYNYAAGLSSDHNGYNYKNNVFSNTNQFSGLKNYSINNTTPIIVDDPQFWGSNREDIIREGIWDMEKGAGFAYFDLSTRLIRPNPDAHGIVWKVVVNGYDAQDEFEMLPPLGVGKHKFEVYFNRPMDTSVAPTISMGVRAPYTQNAISEDGSWSADSTIYTAYLTITGKTASDGLNRIYVYGAEDDEHFEIPEENMRFNVQVSAAGSLSTGLMAEAGLGKVALTWQTDEEDFEDLLGYNVYRYTTDTAGISSDTICINQTVIDAQDSAFVDFDVVPGETYYYYIKQLTTALTSYSLSNAVAATPLTAQKGDANGSMSVDVADVVTEVAYLTGNNPQPFIFEAADVNADQVVNILDIVGTVNIITNPAASSLGFSDDNTATYSIEDGILYVETPVVLGGVQFSFDAEAEISALEALNGFEQMTWSTAETFNFMAYSMSGKNLGVGKHALLYVGNAALEQIILSNTQGQNVPAIKKTATDLSSVEAMQMRLPSPNPFTTQVNIPYVVGQTGAHNIRFVFTNIAGLVVDLYTTTNTFGEYTYTWQPSALTEGVYFVTLYVDGKKMQSSKLVKVN